MFKELGAMMNLLGNKGKLQEEVAKFQQFVAQLTVEGTSGGGMVTAKVNGKMEVLSLTISPDASLAEASTIMADRRVKILPVAEGDVLRGVITRMDILTLHVLNPRR